LGMKREQEKQMPPKKSGSAPPMPTTPTGDVVDMNPKLEPGSSPPGGGAKTPPSPDNWGKGTPPAKGGGSVFGQGAPSPVGGGGVLQTPIASGAPSGKSDTPASGGVLKTPSGGGEASEEFAPEPEYPPTPKAPDPVAGNKTKVKYLTTEEARAEFELGIGGS